MAIIADFILIIHFVIVAFITMGFFFIPICYKFKNHLAHNKRVRVIHIALMGFVTAESILGLTCPLTTIEQTLRNQFHSKTFINYWITKIIYWDFPSLFFLIIYCLFFFGACLLWKVYPPTNKL